MNIVLFEPQIPQNTGNVVRTCSVTGTSLTLIEPLGFSVDDRWLKRAGLDYWEGVRVDLKDSLRTYLSQIAGTAYFFSSKAVQCYSDVQYNPEDSLIFGSETAGLPEWVFKEYSTQLVRLPMKEGSRCLNLATSVGIALFEALRQQNFTQLQK